MFTGHSHMQHIRRIESESPARRGKTCKIKERELPANRIIRKEEPETKKEVMSISKKKKRLPEKSFWIQK